MIHTYPHSINRNQPLISRKFLKLLAALLSLTAVLWLAPSQSAYAAVDCTNNSWPVATEADLNDAIACFNAKPAGTYTISLTQDINLTASSSTITSSAAGAQLRIQGNGFTVDGQNTGGLRPFTLTGGNTNVTINNITITRGKPTNHGGGIYNSAGRLTINNSTVSNNTAASAKYGGGIANFDGTVTINNSTISNNTATDGGGDGGGGIYHTGNGLLTVNNSTISGNESDSDAGAIANFNATTRIINSTLSGNETRLGGGAIYSWRRSLTIINSTISDNIAHDTGGGIFVNNSNVTIISSTFSHNTAERSIEEGGAGILNAGGTINISNTIIANSIQGRDCRNHSGTINDNGNNIVEDNSCGFSGGSDPLLGPLQDNGGPTFTRALLPGSPAINNGSTSQTTDQRGVFRIGSVDDIGAYEIHDCNTTNSWTVGDQSTLNDAITCYNAHVISREYTINIAADIPLSASSAPINSTRSGSQLWIEGNGFTVDGQNINGVRPFTIQNSTTPVTIHNITITGGNTTDFGGGILNTNSTLTLSNSTVSGNAAAMVGGGIANGGGTLTISSSTINGNVATDNGGGIANGGGTILIGNSTVSGNIAGTSGGGIYNYNGATTLSNTTISSNDAPSGGGVINRDGTLTVSNTIVANSSGADCVNDNGTINNNGHNIVEDNSCGFPVGGDPMVGPLQDNGGSTFTHALRHGSPAIDNGDTTLTQDQRGISRPQATADDIGAVEALFHTLNVTSDGSGSGSLSSTPAGIDCGVTCAYDFVVGTAVNLSHNADIGSVFAGWSGDCSGSGACVVTMDGTKAVNATFVPDADCTANSWLADSEHALKAAILCYNTQTSAGTYTITLTQNINLTLNNPTINNATAGIQLRIEGSGFTVNGQDINGIRPFTIAGSNTHVAINDLTITGGHPAGNGGGLFVDEATISISNSTISGNTAGDGGGLFVDEATVTISNSTVSGNTGDDGGGIYINEATGTISSSIISNNSASGFGGGLFYGYNGGSLAVSDGRISQNTAASGGGLFAGSGSLTVNNNIINENTATNVGGGLDIVGGSTTISSSTIYSNTAGAFGGGMATGSNGTMNVTNSTISGNTGGTYGGGVHIDGNTTINNSTISHNAAGTGGGIYSRGTTNVSNTIVANSSSGGDCGQNGGVINDNGHNMVEDLSCGFPVGGDPLLGPLQDNGGDTFTHALLPGSPAIDNGDTPLTTDQRGIGRPQGTADDIGALEAVFHTLSVASSGSGSGTLGSIPAGVDCGLTCTHDFVLGTAVSLTHSADPSSTFTSWSGDCTGSGACILTIDGPKAVTATFTLNQYPLTTTTDGNGSGSLTLDPAGGIYDHGTVVTVTHSADVGSTFTGWSGDCTGTGACVLTMDAAKAITATFTLNQYPLTTATDGTGFGTLTLDPAGGIYDYGTVVTVTHAADPSSTFTGWSGDCTGTGACVLTVDAAKAVTATFTLNQYPLATATNGTGSGSLTLDPAGGIYDHGTVVTVTHSADVGSTFSGWSGDCTGLGACMLTMDAPKAVTATFTLGTNVLSVFTSGNGQGTITSTPTGIDCGPTCAANFDYGTQVTLTAVAETYANFMGWSGACTGLGNCVLTMDTAQAVTATFSLNQYPLTTATIGSGSGSLTLDPAGGIYDHGTIVTVTHAADPGSTFTGWSGACTGNGDCVLTMDAPKTVTATFTLGSNVLTVSSAGTGQGTITSTPAGIDCGSTCAASFDYGTLITLTAVAGPHADFMGWQGACSGLGDCLVTVDASMIVTATFNTTHFFVYLPFAATNNPDTTPNLPDLIVTDVQANGSDVLVTIENQGSAPTQDSFWVDFYVNPNPVPTSVNEIWSFVAAQGIVWGVEQVLAPGESLTLIYSSVPGAANTYYVAEDSHFNGMAAGTPIYAQVDSANALANSGAVLETHELLGTPYNNISQQYISTDAPLTYTPVPSAVIVANSTALSSRPE